MIISSAYKNMFETERLRNLESKMIHKVITLERLCRFQTLQKAALQ